MDALPNPNPPHFSGLGAGTELHWLVHPGGWVAPRWLGFCISVNNTGNLHDNISLLETDGHVQSKLKFENTSFHIHIFHFIDTKA